MKLFLSNLQINITASCSLKFNLLASKEYTTPLVSPSHTYHCHYETNEINDLSDHQKVFDGESFDEQLMPYRWEVYKSKFSVAIWVDFYNHPEIIEATAILNSKDKTIQINLLTTSDQPITIDPLFHPLGSLIMVYLVYQAGGFMIHASGVRDKDVGHMFSAISGTGKSTMAGIWKREGATVVNDDRLWIQKIGDQWQMFNTPMIWHSQYPMMAPVNKVFLIRQSPVNEIKPLSGLNTSMKLMANCIQHLYDKEMTSGHLDRVLNFTSQLPVYDCGFKPDGEIVKLIRGM